MNTQSTQTAGAPTQINQESSALLTAQNELHDRLLKLAERLIPVLREPDPSESPLDKEQLLEMLCPIAETFRDARFKTKNSINLVQSLLDRNEL